MRLLGLAALGFMLPAVSQACGGFLSHCKPLYVDESDRPNFVNLVADCGETGGVLTQHLKFNLFNGNGVLLWLRNGAGEIAKCSDFEVTEDAILSATCNGKRTDTIGLSMLPSLTHFLNLNPANVKSTPTDDHIALINYNGVYSLCPNNECCRDEWVVSK